MSKYINFVFTVVFYIDFCFGFKANKTNGQQPPTSQPNNTGWGQPGSKPVNNNAIPPTNQPPSTVANPPNNNVTSNNTKQQLEQLNSMREAIFSQDGWGGVCIFK